MADSEAFDKCCSLLEELTELTRLEARGTIRIALKQAGLSPTSVLASELSVVVRAVLAKELSSRGIDEADRVAESVSAGLDRIDDAARADSPESVFSRLGGGE